MITKVTLTYPDNQILSGPKLLYFHKGQIIFLPVKKEI